MDKKVRKEVLERIKKAGSEEYQTDYDDKGKPKLKKKSNVKKGRKSRASGARFELKVRDHLESQRWHVDKWNNNVDLEKGEIVKAKKKYNPFRKVMTVGTGFPDFIAFKRVGEFFDVMAVECKMNGILSKEEKEKCAFLIKKNIFNDLWVAKKGEKRGSIEYVDFKERYNKFLDG